MGLGLPGVQIDIVWYYGRTFVRNPILPRPGGFLPHVQNRRKGAKGVVMKWSSLSTRISLFLGSLLTVLVVFLFAATSARGQAGTTSLHGVVTDKSGAAVVGAKVTLNNAQQGLHRETTTNDSGEYDFHSIVPGTYVLTIEASGFRRFEQTKLELLVNSPATLDVRMEIGTSLQTIEVSGTALTVNTQDATLGNAFNQNQISSLPFEGRDPVGILSLQPGVTTVADRDQVDQNSDSRSGSVNGARSDQTNVTLDGVDDNDQVKGYAFQGALRATLDSLQEFRVTTTNAGADQGRSSGAQVALVTKSGTNEFHGTAYEYNRPTNMVANDYFHKHSELQNGEPNIPARLLRNTFGGSFGGPIKKDRAYFFVAYEGQRTRESLQVVHPVPSLALRDGVIQYLCQTNSDGSTNTTACPGGTLTVPSQASPGKMDTITVQPGYNALTPAQIATMDPKCSANGTCPWGPGINPNSIKTFNLYPLPNSNQLGDGFNFQAFTFAAPTPSKLDTYVARFDYNLTASGSQRLFVRLGLQNDHSVPTETPGVGLFGNGGTTSGAEEFPGQGPSQIATNNTKGIIGGYTWSISTTKTNSLHYGFVRQGIGLNGTAAPEPQISLRGLDFIYSPYRSTNSTIPVHNVTDDFIWTKGKHTLQFGGNWRFITYNKFTTENSFSDAQTNTGFLPTTGYANRGTSFDPAAFGFPAVDPSFGNGYNFPMTALAGIITEVDATYLRDKTGTSIPEGTLINRQFRSHELETYLQDAWRIKPNVTFTYGVRYSLLEPPYETHGNQTSPDISLHDFFGTRLQDMTQGISYSPVFQIGTGGISGNRQPFWDWDYKDIAPRVSLAYSPGYKGGLLGDLFGGPGKSSIRLGAGVYYDHFGESIINTFDNHGSFGLITTLSTVPGTVDPDTAPRYTGPLGAANIPASITPPGPTGPFPLTPPTAQQPGGFAIYWGMDDKLKTPYAYGFDFSFSRELARGFVFEAVYVNRLGRRLLQERDLGQPLNLFDPKSGLTYDQAITALAKLYRATSLGGQGVTTATFNPSMVSPKVAQYWADMLQPLQAGGAYSLGTSCGASSGSTTIPVVAIFDLFCSGSLNETTPLSSLDIFGITDANNAGVSYFPSNGPLSFFQSQFASLYAWSSVGRSNYNAGEFSLRHQVTHGLTWDLNYTFSKSIDTGSAAERISEFENATFSGSIINAFEPQQQRAVSDFDATHQVNSNFVYELPFGGSQRWGSSWNRAMAAVLGGWSWSGLGRWTSGLPFNVNNGFDFPTNWQQGGFAVALAKPKTGVYTDCAGDPTVFAALAASSTLCGPNNAGLVSNFISSNWAFPFPGQSGSRNQLRGPGYFGIDMALRKTWKFTERQSLAFSWEVFNITNSVRFDAASTLPAIDTAGSFGTYSRTLTRPRVMEFALRYSF